MTPRAPTETLRQAFDAALRAAAPSVCLPPALRDYARRPALVLGAGKAAASMAVALCANWDAPTRGMVVTRYGHGLKDGEKSGGIEVVEAGHPSPDAASLAAGARLLELAASASAADSGEYPSEYLICLVSGGGSSLAAAPLPGVTFEQKRAAANFLMRQGADIREINCVRKHLSKLKGGRLAAAAHPAPVITFVISDVPGDEVGDIASGPTIADATTQANAIEILERYRYPSLAELTVLRDPKCETPKLEAPEFARDSVHLIATASTAMDAAARYLHAQGYEVVYLGDDLADEAQVLGSEHARLAKQHRASGKRVAILSGGETRVVLGETGRGGRGGRNTEYIAALALELDGVAGIYALAADTDGIDGAGDHAGATIVPETLRSGAERGISLAQALAQHDTYSYFDATGHLLRTGPTRTNVNDFRLILCQA